MLKLYNINGDPFASLSAEEEKPYIKEIFYKQQYYDSLVCLTEASASRFILGQRGQGKSATILHLIEDIKPLGVLPILIDHYKGFPLQQNENYFLYEMIQSLTFCIAKRLLETPKLSKHLNITQKEQVSFFIEAFYDPICAEECVNCAKNIAKKKSINKIRAFINSHIRFFNNVIGMGVKVGADLIKSYAGVDIDYSSIGGEYLHGFDLKEIKTLKIEDIVAWGTSKLLKVLYNLRDISKQLGYKSIVFMFDKIDEVPGVNSDVNKVSEFMLEILTDTELLYSDGISIVVSLWSEIKKNLNSKGVRFDKFKEVDIRWRADELEELLNKRLNYFTIEKQNKVTFETLVPDKSDRDKILELSDHSPRSLFNLLGCIFAEEKEENAIVSFSSNAINKGTIMYCKKFDYVSAQPSRTGKSQDVLSWITKILRLKLTQFTLEQYSTYSLVKPSTTGIKHIETLIKFNLIRDSMCPAENDDILYEVTDPRLKYLISRGEQSLEI